MKPEFEALIARGNVTLAEIESLRGNTAEWEALIPALDTEAFIHQLEHCIQNCGNRQPGTYDYALQHAFGPEVVKRIAKLDAELKDHRVRLAFSGREILLGIKPDGTPSEASLHIKNLEARLRVIPCLVRDIDKTRDRDEIIAIARGEEPPPTDRQLALRGLNPDER